MPSIPPFRAPTIHEVSTTLVMAVTIVSSLTFFGVGISPPWATAGEFKELRKELASVGTAQEIQGRALLLLQRAYYVDQLEQAEEELKLNPSSSSAKAAKASAERWIRYIDDQLGKLPPG